MKIFITLLFFSLSVSAQQLNYQTNEYEYDNLNRLTRVVFSNGTIYEYEYDNLGNRIQRTVTEEQDDELTYVPDDAFEQRLIDLGHDDVMDDYVITNNINDIIVINLSELGIQDATGIEDFEALEVLFLQENELTELDISENVNLEVLFCYLNLLNNLNVSQNLSLENLNCYGNNIASLDVSNNINLESLICEENQLQELNLTHNIALRYLDCADNFLTSLNLSQNVNLESLQCGFNDITEIDVSNNINLEIFNVMANNLSGILDVSQNPNLESIACYSNQLTELDLSNNPLFESLFGYNNQFTDFDFSQNPNLDFLRIQNNQLESLNLKNSNNSILTDFRSDNNPNLFCIQVDDEVNANAGNGVYANWNIDSIVTFSEDCSTLSIDDNELASITIFPNPTDGLLQIEIPPNFIENDIQYEILDVNGKRILDGLIENGELSKTIDMKRLSTGNYFLKFISDNKTWTTQIIKK